MDQILAPAIIPSSPQEKDWVFNQLVSFNRQALGMSPETFSRPLNFHLRSPEGQIIAGINATMLGQSSVYVAILWVDTAQRGQRYGATLLRHVEDVAQAQGAQMIHLDTFDFQAQGFYQKQGYTQYSALENSPTPGHTRYYFCKRLGV